MLELHRADTVPDWEKVPESEWNEYQKRAAETNGWDTPGNRATAAGLAVSLAGIEAISHDHYLVGAALLGYGRYKDLEDGRLAEATGTKSPDGERNDALVDKLIMGRVLPVLKRKRVITKNQFIGLALQHGTAAALTGVAKARGNEMHARRSGKLSTGIEWGGIGLGVVAQGLSSAGFERTAEKLEGGRDALIGIGLALGAVSLLGYAKDAYDQGEMQQELSETELTRDTLEQNKTTDRLA